MHKQGVTVDVIGREGRAFIEAFGAEIKSLASKHGYDPEKHFRKSLSSSQLLNRRI